MRAKAGAMQKALFIVIAVGLGIGLLIPTGASEAPQADAVVAESPAAEATPKARSQPSTSGSWGGEARIRRRGNGHFYGNAMVNGQPVEMIIDTGASGVALTIEDARRSGIAVDPASFEVVGTGASGPVRGQFVQLSSVELEGRRVAGVSGAVLEGLEQSLLGQSYLSRIGSITMNGEYLTLR